MIELTWKRRLFIILIVALAFAGGVSLGWIGRGRYEQPVGGIPTTATMQMAVTDEIEAEPSATSTPTATAPATSTAAPTVAQPTSTYTVTPASDCVPIVGQITCVEISKVTSTPGVFKLYWIGGCIENYSLQLQREQSEGDWLTIPLGEWSFEFDPPHCTRDIDRRSPNHLVVDTRGVPGKYTLFFQMVDSTKLYSQDFYWEATATSTPTASPTAEPTATEAKPTVSATTPEPDMPAGTTPVSPSPATVTPSWVSPFDIGGICVYDVRIDGNYEWVAQGADWTLWDTMVIGEAQYVVLGLNEVTGKIWWLLGDPRDPCVRGGQLAGVAGLRSYLTAIGREDLEIPPPPAVGDLD